MLNCNLILILKSLNKHFLASSGANSKNGLSQSSHFMHDESLSRDWLALKALSLK